MLLAVLLLMGLRILWLSWHSADHEITVGRETRIERSGWVRLLVARPSDVAAWLMVARLSDSRGDASGARAAYQFAYRLAPMDRQVLAEVAASELLASRPNEGARLLAQLAASYPSSRESAFIVLSKLFAIDPSLPVWRQLATEPNEWMEEFILSACYRKADPRVLGGLLVERIRIGRHRREESNCVIQKLREAGDWAGAYRLWINTLPPARLREIGSVYNGGFEEPIDATGFDWVLDDESLRNNGHLAEIVSDDVAEGKFALRIRFAGRPQVGVAARELLALPPGNYELSGQAKIAFPDTVRAVQWVVRCAESDTAPVLVRSDRFSGNMPWRVFTVPFQVPENCRGQSLTLEVPGTTLSSQLVSGTAWFDALRIRQLSSPSH
jgi:hypothetical protein